ncbi:unnamed protein product [Rotaria sp. Silwood2]|nr:unnamed protein product [Rotaria sp. Silwood2]CAF3125042.1 unnamed protein product [Rotaria sp. Silwood2]CAF4387967.1 unnamed protein product [Rotaria sp. Silwood2]CAF4421564.1 unnamed protein product [Rotaria sp. Silwood2]CAF4436509.1 unnamed protein product [Rotaria sp. Silwood2]
MNSLSTILIFVLIVLLTIGPIPLITAQDCGPNEIKLDCAPLLSCQPSCSNLHGLVCPRVCALNQCICRNGFVRDDQNDLQCIEQTHCNTNTIRFPTRCGTNEVAVTCALLQTCQPSCDNPKGTLCPLSFFRKGNVIETPICSENEEYSNCTNPCQLSCEEPNREPCETLRCSEGCVCSEDYFRATNDISSPCVQCIN